MAKKLSKIITSAVLVLSLIMVNGGTKAYAKGTKMLSEAIKEQVVVTITNNETGKVDVLNNENLEGVVKVKQTKSIDISQSNQVEYSIFIPIETESDKLSLFTSTGGTQTSGGVTAKLNVDFDVSSNNEQVRLNRLYGSWQPHDANGVTYLISSRSANAHSGLVWGKTINKTPTSNSFSYNTGWGYNDRAGGTASPRAWSSAVVKVLGMGGSHTINVSFPYAQL